jgi:hypothetical protein
VIDEPVVTDEDVRIFLQAVRALGQGQPKGYAKNTDIAQRMGLDPSGLDPKNLVTRDSRLYRRVAKHCADKRYITATDMYRDVAITPLGEQYLRSVE